MDRHRIRQLEAGLVPRSRVVTTMLLQGLLTPQSLEGAYLWDSPILLLVGLLSIELPQIGDVGELAPVLEHLLYWISDLPTLSGPERYLSLVLRRFRSVLLEQPVASLVWAIGATFLVIIVL